MSIASQIIRIKESLPEQVRLTAVSKFHSVEAIQEAYDAGQRVFGENRVQELLGKYSQLPATVEWHFIGHLQVNKVKYIAPFIDTVQSVDSMKLLDELNRCAAKARRRIKVLLQIHIAREEHKFGFSFAEAEELLKNNFSETWSNLTICGLMGMATFTDDPDNIRKEFTSLQTFFVRLKQSCLAENTDFKELSMGMSDDYPLAIEAGSTMIRIGSKIFGART
ncbi:MAG: YggS family pyridoxal phosphate-dependent enzyme [Candidatus Symbiothrix sp.]|jgi:pyridoxal phosphate enzyme (YggS family)|nr:YggS family pyridoxal phosphate-dependent enzyme [Candidatus Symbiothrix sp.]